jgi:tetratricopeptide (TPR) repeat protein
VRDRFEAALLSAASAEARPRIDDYLRDLHEPERSEVFCSLLVLELRFRIENGEQPNLEEYLHQFPESASRIKLVFQQTKSGDPAPTSSLAAKAPITRDDVVENPTVSYFADGGVPGGTTEGHAAVNGDVPAGAQSTEAVQRKTRRRTATALPTVPGYEILAIVGRGGMGIVYQARDLKLQRLVALKMIDPERERAPGPEDLKQMLAEARAVAQLGHPHIVHIYAIGEHDGQPYLALEFLDGGNLSKKLGGLPQPANAAATLIETLARTMHYTHQKQVVHRDLKPSNILLSADGTVKIADFGLAKRLDRDVGQDEDGYILGTIFYMAPEQAWGKNQHVGNAADIYALGVILYEMLTGGPPFKAAKRWDTVQQVRTAEPVPPRRLVPQVPLDLELICLKCLRKDPKDRFASAAELAEELRRFQEGRPIQTRPTPVWERAWKWAKRQPALAASIIATFLVGVIALGSLLLHLEHRAEKAEGELKKRDEVAKLRDRLQDLHRGAQDKSNQGLPQEAQGLLKAAFELMGAEPALRDREPAFNALQQQVESQDQAQRGKLAAEDAYREFYRYRDTALFSGMVLTGVDLAMNVKTTRDACAAAVKLFSDPLDPHSGPRLPEYMTPERKRECQAACYELLLVWAEAEVVHGAQLDQALGHLNRATLFHPATHAYHLRRARLLTLQNKPADAQKEMDRAAKLKPAGALDYFLVGDSLLRHGETVGDARLRQTPLKQAADNFALAVREDPGHFWAWYMLGMCNLQMNDMKLARQNFTTCLGYRKDLWYPYMSRGFVNGQLNDFAAADKDLRQALALKPDRQAEYGILVNQGELRLKQARLVEALVPIPWPTAFTPNLEFACRGAADIARGHSLAAAADVLEAARNLHKDGYQAYLYLALVRQQQNQLEEGPWPKCGYAAAA